MPNATVRANARTSPEPTPEAKLLALATDCEAAARVADETADALAAADHRGGVIAIPKEIVKTQGDRDLGLFIGPGVGNLYKVEEIACIRALRRRIGRQSVEKNDENEWLAYHRCGAILGAWDHWQEKIVEADERSGYADALRADMGAGRALDGLQRQLLGASASTLEGLFAKARGLTSIFPDAECLASKISEEVVEFAGCDEFIAALSLARDVLALAEQKEAAHG